MCALNIMIFIIVIVKMNKHVCNYDISINLIRIVIHMYINNIYFFVIYFILYQNKIKK